MKKIQVSSIKAGTKFTKAVYVDESNLLVPANVEIRQKDIERLQKWHVEFVLTEGSPISAEAKLEEAAATIHNVMDEGGQTELGQIYQTSVIQANRIYGELGFNRGVEKSEIDRIVERLLRATNESSSEMLAFVLRSDHSDPSVGLSAVNTVILSLLVAMTLSMDQQRMRTLGTAALLHDVGMMKVPQDIVQKNANLSAEEIKKMRAHTLYSYQIIAKELEYPEEIGMIALQHHERWDGKGYPRGLSEKKIAVEARIISVTDAFEAMVKDKPYRNSMIAYAAMRQLLNDNSRHFDSEILKIFIKSVGIYPLGSFVILNNGSVGRVIKINENAPLRPAIRLLVDKTGKKYEKDAGAIIDLAQNTEIFIARAVDPKAIAAKKMI